MKNASWIIRRISAMVIALCMVVSLVGYVPAVAVETDNTEKPSYVALGDSISTGYGLADPETEGFAYLVAKEKGYELTNLAVNGNTITGIVAQLQTDEVVTAVKNADLITITVGGNDLMALLYQAIANQYNAIQTDDAKKIEITDVSAILNDASDARRLTLMQCALDLLNPTSENYLPKAASFENAVTAFSSALKQITASIAAQNPDAVIVVTTQYNPYAEFNGVKYSNLIDLTPIYAGIEAGVTALNTAIQANAADGGYIVADVKTAFDKADSDTDLYVADPATLNLDVHPNAAGHAVIAKVIEERISEPTTSRFTDVTDDAWYADAVNTAAENSWMVGISETEFAPNATLTRAELAQILYNKAGKPEVSSLSTFSDVPATAWYAKAVAWAQQNNVVSGVGGNQFAPNQTITRESIAVMLYNDAEKPTVTGTLDYKDAASVSEWAKDAMLWATQNKVINGAVQSDGTLLLNPTSGATRAETAAMLTNYYSK